MPLSESESVLHEEKQQIYVMKIIRATDSLILSEMMERSVTEMVICSMIIALDLRV